MQRAHRAAPGNVAGQITWAYQWSFGRDPDPNEQIAARRLVVSHGLAALARAIFNSNEFLYVD